MRPAFWWRRFQRIVVSTSGQLMRAWSRYVDPVFGAEQALLFSIEENPSPRDTGTFTMHCCGKLLAMVSGLNLSTNDPEPVISQLRIHSAELRTCDHHGLRFRNVSPWLQQHILAEMAELKIRETAAHSR